MTDHERFRKAYALDVKSVTDEGVIEGYASVFDVIDSQGDIIAPGAFKRTINAWNAKGRGVPVLWHHDASEPIGVTTSLAEDAHGLRVSAHLVREVRRATEAHALAKAGALGGLSIGFSVPRTASDGEPASMVDEKRGARVFREVRLWEYSLVTFPANEAAVLTGVKSASEVHAELIEALHSLRESVEQSDTRALLRDIRLALSLDRPPVGRARDADPALAEVLREAHHLLSAHHAARPERTPA